MVIHDGGNGHHLEISFICAYGFRNQVRFSGGLKAGVMETFLCSNIVLKQIHKRKPDI